MLRRLSALALVTGMLVGAGPAAAAHRPGAVLWTRSDFPSGIAALTASADRLVAAGPSWVNVRRADGSFDESFGSSGFVSFAEDPRLMIATAVQPDGRILVAESGGRYVYPADTGHLIRRLTPDGRPDPSFGGDGDIQPDLGGPQSELTDLALQPDGRVLVAGGDGQGGDGIVVRRYMADGSPDTGFGTLGETRLRAGEEAGVRLALRPDGDIVLSVYRPGERLGLALLTASGQPDRSFGNRGEIVPVEYGRAEWGERVRPAHGPVVLPDGRLRLAAAYRSAGDTHARMAVVGLTENGHPDEAFGRVGLALAPHPDLTHNTGTITDEGGEFAHRALLDTRGNILVAGDLSVGDAEATELRAAVVRRFREDGSLDRSFGRNGMARLKIDSPGYPAIVTRIALLGGDRLAIAHDVWNAKYDWSWSGHDIELRMLGANYDDEPPAITAAAGCRRVAIRVRDLSALDAVVVRAGHRVVRRTSAKRIRFRTPRRARRLTIRATDLAGNSSRVSARVPRC